MSELAKTDYMIPELDPANFQGTQLSASPLEIFDAGTGVIITAVLGGVLGGLGGYYLTRNRRPGWTVAGTSLSALGGFYLAGMGARWWARRKLKTTSEATP